MFSLDKLQKCDRYKQNAYIIMHFIMQNRNITDKGHRNKLWHVLWMVHHSTQQTHHAVQTVASDMAEGRHSFILNKWTPPSIHLFYESTKCWLLSKQRRGNPLIGHQSVTNTVLWRYDKKHQNQFPICSPAWTGPGIGFSKWTFNDESNFTDGVIT